MIRRAVLKGYALKRLKVCGVDWMEWAEMHSATVDIGDDYVTGGRHSDVGSLWWGGRVWTGNTHPLTGVWTRRTQYTHRSSRIGIGRSPLSRRHTRSTSSVFRSPLPSRARVPNIRNQGANPTYVGTRGRGLDPKTAGQMSEPTRVHPSDVNLARNPELEKKSSRLVRS